MSIDLIWFISTLLSLHDIISFFFTLNTVLFTGPTLTLLTILKLYSHTFTFTLHGSYLHYLYKQTGRTLTLLTILTLYLHLHLHCTVHTYIVYTSTNYNLYNTYLDLTHNCETLITYNRELHSLCNIITYKTCIYYTFHNSAQFQ